MYYGNIMSVDVKLNTDFGMFVPYPFYLNAKTTSQHFEESRKTNKYLRVLLPPPPFLVKCIQAELW